MAGTFPIESREAASALDMRRISFEARCPWYRKQLFTTTRNAMEDYINEFGATDVTNHDDLRHVPVKVVPGGVAFYPERMTMAMLEDVYGILKYARRPSGSTLEKVLQYLEDNPGGCREADITDGIIDRGMKYHRTTVLRCLQRLVDAGDVWVREETTRGTKKATPRKRYFLSYDPILSLDQGLYNTIAV